MYDSFIDIWEGNPIWGGSLLKTGKRQKNETTIQ